MFLDILKKLIEADQQLFLFLNQINHPVFDVIMFWFSNKYFWIPFYALILLYLVWQFGKKAIIIVVFIILTITLADQFTSSFMKPYFERLRPCHHPELTELIHTVNDKCGGNYGFASSHAANSFGLAMFLWLLLRSRLLHVYWMFIWAAIVSYSRIYLGVHYPADILIGGIVGIISGYIFFQAYRIIQQSG